MSDTGTPAPPPPSPPPASRQVGKPRGVGITILLFIVTLGIYSFWWWGYNFAELKRYRGDGIGGPLGVVFALIIAIVNFFILGSEVERLYREDGKEPPITAIWGLLVFIPLVGGFIWIYKAQTALNDFWVSKGATPV